MAIQGLRATTDFDAVTGQRPNAWREGVLRLDPVGETPLYGLTTLMRSRRVDDPLFNWFEQLTNKRRLTLSANLSASATTVSVTGDALMVKEGDLLLVENTGEVLRVSQNPTGNSSVKVTRGFAGTTAAAVTYNGAGVNPNLAVMGSAYEEGSLPPTGIAYDPTRKYNFTQIFRDTFAMTRTARRTRLRTRNDVNQAKKECLMYHKAGIERAFFFGPRWEGTVNGKITRTTGGIDYFVPTANVISGDATNGNTLADLEAWSEQIFEYGSDEKMVFCGNKLMTTLTQIIRYAKGAMFEIMPAEKEYGMSVQRVRTPHGVLVFKTHKMFNQLSGGTNAGSNTYYGRNSQGFVLDMANISYVYIDDTTFQSKLEANGLDGLQSGFLTECGLELHFPETHFILKDIVKAKAE